MKFNEIKAPRPFGDQPRPWVFLAGSIEMGLTERWQETVANALSDYATVLNPRRDDWDSSWRQSIDDPRFREQVEWELLAQEQADLIVMYFAPGNRSPITLLEFGLSARSGCLIVCCPKGFWRRGNLEVACHRYHVPLAGLLEGTIALAKVRLLTDGA